MPAIVFFNGNSVKQFFDIEKKYEEYGCNFIENHRQVDNVVCYDNQTMRKITIFNNNVKYWSRPQWHKDPWLKDDYTQEWDPTCSGLYALWIARKHKVIYLLGCDWNINDNSIFDNNYGYVDVKVTRYDKSGVGHTSVKPKKFSNARKAWLEKFAKEYTTVIVHDTQRNFANVKWMSPLEFKEKYNNLV